MEAVHDVGEARVCPNPSAWPDSCRHVRYTMVERNNRSCVPPSSIRMLICDPRWPFTIIGTVSPYSPSVGNAHTSRSAHVHDPIPPGAVALRKPAPTPAAPSAPDRRRPRCIRFPMRARFHPIGQIGRRRCDHTIKLTLRRNLFIDQRLNHRFELSHAARQVVDRLAFRIGKVAVLQRLQFGSPSRRRPRARERPPPSNDPAPGVPPPIPRPPSRNRRCGCCPEFSRRFRSPPHCRWSDAACRLLCRFRPA